MKNLAENTLPLICMISSTMICFLPLVLFLSIHFQVNLTQSLQTPAFHLHRWCQSWLDPKSNPKNLTVSFICGKKVVDREQKTLLQKSGLYHAIVVSGGHFLFLDAFLKRLALPSNVRYLTLWIYYLMTGLQAPGLRCLIQMMVAGFTQRQHLKINAVTLGFTSGLLCLAINFQLWHSLSFWLSFAVSLALAIAGEFRTAKDRFVPFLLPIMLIYVFLIPFNFSNGYLHPLNLLLGYILLIPFSFILLLQAGLVTIGLWLSAPTLYSWSLAINENLFLILKKWTLIIPAKNNGQPDLFVFWFYFLVLILFFHFAIVQFRRGAIHE